MLRKQGRKERMNECVRDGLPVMKSRTGDGVYTGSS